MKFSRKAKTYESKRAHPSAPKPTLRRTSGREWLRLIVALVVAGICRSSVAVPSLNSAGEVVPRP